MQELQILFFSVIMINTAIASLEIQKLKQNQNEIKNKLNQILASIERNKHNKRW